MHCLVLIYESCNGQEVDASPIDASQSNKTVIESISIEVINKPAPVNAGSPFTAIYSTYCHYHTRKTVPLDNYPITVLTHPPVQAAV
ncbi:hypothetical protein [Treponema sp. OMZ 803]|uniref:hypothetical protein n=1 Tax=Treponema sp. OMZ 803 TaxID=120682 RepID=UPI0020A3F368|nr:hypothetical protein [Treponema sp. OMZ 803]